MACERTLGRGGAIQLWISSDSYDKIPIEQTQRRHLEWQVSSLRPRLSLDWYKVDFFKKKGVFWFHFQGSARSTLKTSRALRMVLACSFLYLVARSTPIRHRDILL